MARILIIDSALEKATAAISENGIIIAQRTNSIQKEHASFLHYAVKEILTNKKLLPSALDAVAVTSGPGSYTGLRVGFAAAKGFCFALNKPLITIGTLQMLAKAALIENKAKRGALYCPMIDARRDEVYTAVYDNVLHEVVAPHALVLSEQSFEKEFRSDNIFFFGDGSKKLSRILTKKIISFLQFDDTLPALNILATEKFVDKDFADLRYAAPLYAKEFYNG